MAADKLMREEFDQWFLDHAKAPIDPWHKEFAWSVWQAANSNKHSVPYEAKQALLQADAESFTAKQTKTPVVYMTEQEADEAEFERKLP